MNIALNPAASFGNPFTWLFKKASAVTAARMTVIPAVGDMHCIQKGATLVVPRPMHREIVCLRGSLWITHDRDPRDVTLEPGQSYRADRNARLLIHALDNAELRLISAAWSKALNACADLPHQPTSRGIHL